MTAVNEIIKDEKPLRKRKRRNLSPIGQKIDCKISCLQKGYLSEDSRKQARARADLANLRRGLTAGPGERVEIWRLTQVDVSDNAPDEPTREEFAVHVSMTLYAAHQQSRTKPMHRPAEGLGHAAHSVVGYGDDENPSARARFDALVMSSTPRELRRHLRSFVSLLRAKEIPFGLWHAGRRHRLLPASWRGRRRCDGIGHASTTIFLRQMASPARPIPQQKTSARKTHYTTV